MIQLPKILIIDDELGIPSTQSNPNKDRRAFCDNCHLIDITGDIEKYTQEDYHIAEAVFCRGQKIEDGCAVNFVDMAIDAIRKGWENAYPRWAMILLDLQFKEGKLDEKGYPKGESDNIPSKYFGLTVLNAIKIAFPLIEVAICSATEQLDTVKIYGTHAKIFLDKGSLDWKELAKCLWDWGLLEDDRQSENRILGSSPVLLSALSKVRRAAMWDRTINILLTGERGSGKELFAKALHDWSERRDDPYVPINTTTIVSTLIESELFGYKKGAHNRADKDRAGFFESAESGTIFLDEIGNISFDMQDKLLRVLEARNFYRVGDTKIRSLNAAVITATNKNLRQMAEKDEFSKDLFDRLNSSLIVVPPLREIKEDIAAIAKYLSADVCRRIGIPGKEITPEAIKKLENYLWPGNVRELKTILNQAITDWKKIQYLLPEHIILPELHLKAADESFPDKSSQTSSGAVTKAGQYKEKVKSFNDLISAIDSFDVDSQCDDYDKLKGTIKKLQKSYARLVAKILTTALNCESIKRKSVEKDEINLTGAIKCLFDDAKISPTKASAYIKKLLQIEDKSDKSEVFKESMKDPVLKEAWDNANKSRPSNPKKADKKTKKAK